MASSTRKEKITLIPLHQYSVQLIRSLSLAVSSVYGCLPLLPVVPSAWMNPTRMEKNGLITIRGRSCQISVAVVWQVSFHTWSCVAWPDVIFAVASSDWFSKRYGNEKNEHESNSLIIISIIIYNNIIYQLILKDLTSVGTGYVQKPSSFAKF